MIIKKFPYLLRYKKGKYCGYVYVNPEFYKLMNLLGKAIKEGKKVEFVYLANNISASWED